MGLIDDVTWQVLTVLLSVVGLITSVLLWRRRGPASGIRGLAWSLLPVAALLTGTWRLLWELGDAVVSWAVRFVFSPIVWLGVSVAGTSLVLFVLAAALRNRQLGTKPRAVPSRSKPARGAGSTTAALPPAGDRLVATESVDDDLADIEAILKRRGIS